MELQDIVRRLRLKQSIKAIKREIGKHRRERTVVLPTSAAVMMSRRTMCSDLY